MWQVRRRLRAAWLGFRLKRGEVYLGHFVAARNYDTDVCDHGNREKYYDKIPSCTRPNVCVSADRWRAERTQDDHEHVCLIHLARSFPHLHLAAMELVTKADGPRND